MTAKRVWVLIGRKVRRSFVFFLSHLVLSVGVRYRDSNDLSRDSMVRLPKNAGTWFTWRVGGNRSRLKIRNFRFRKENSLETIALILWKRVKQQENYDDNGGWWSLWIVACSRGTENEADGRVIRKQSYAANVTTCSPFNRVTRLQFATYARGTLILHGSKSAQSAPVKRCVYTNSLFTFKFTTWACKRYMLGVYAA